MKQKLLLKTMLLLCALVAGSSSVWATDETITITCSNVASTTSYSSTESTFTESGITFGYKSIAINNNGTPSGWAKQQVLQCQGSNGEIYNKTAINGLKSIRVYLVANTNTFTVYSGTSVAPAENGVSRPTTATGTESVTYSSYVNKTVTEGQSTTASYYDFDLSGTNRTYFRIKVGSNVVYIHKIVITYTPSNAVDLGADDFKYSAASYTANIGESNTFPTLTNTHNLNVTYQSTDESVATINTSGVVSLVDEGITTIKAVFAGNSSYNTKTVSYVLTVVDPSLTTIWSEDFSGFSANDVPSGGTYGYSCTDGTSTTKVLGDAVAGGSEPELFIGKNNGAFTAIIPLVNSTYAYSGDLTLKYKTNATELNVKTTTDGITVDGEASAGAGITFNTKDTHKITFKGVTAETENITIVFTATNNDQNVRLDDIVLKGVQTALTKASTPVISPASGTVASGTEVTITCLTDGATIYYTNDGSTPTSGSTAYNPSSKPTITASTTFKAIAIKDGLTDSDVATASYTIATPCATPTFSPAAGEVDKGTTVTISTETDGATIYYTTDGSTPTTSSTAYSSAIIVNTTQTLKAIAVKDGMADSEVASAAYTVRDYATLPFSFDGGKSNLPSGLTESGLGTDYGSSPKMRFDTTGDNLVLKINEAPGTLTFDIQGNSFSGGTFKIQGSADGTAYSDLKVYTSLGSKTNERFILASTVRYIKWVYTTKSNGNVALGNINLTSTITLKPAKEYTTLISPYALDFSGTSITPFIVKDDNANDGYVTLTEVSKVPANTGLILKAETLNAEVNIPVLAAAADDVTGNLMAGSATATTAIAENGGYILKNGAFHPASAGNLPAGKAYLAISASAPILNLDFGGETTGINAVNGSEFKVNGEYYNLAGQRVANPTKGLYIVNGKKVVMK